MDNELRITLKEISSALKDRGGFDILIKGIEKKLSKQTDLEKNYINLLSKLKETEILLKSARSIYVKDSVSEAEWVIRCQGSFISD